MSVATTFICLLMAGTAGSPLEDARKSVADNLRQIESYCVQTRVELPDYAPESPEPVELFCELVQARDGRLRWVEKQQCPEEVEKREMDTIRVFDGQEGRSVSLDAKGNQVAGSVLNDEDIRSLFVDSHNVSEFGRTSGLSIDGRSLSAWLALESARFEGEEQVENVACAKFKVENYVFYLDPKLNFTLKQYALCDEYGDIAFLVEADSLKEVLPGVWLPMSGSTRPLKVMWNGKNLAKVAGWRVVSLSVNEDYADDIFKLEFAPNVPIINRRFPVAGGFVGSGAGGNRSYGVSIPDMDQPPEPGPALALQADFPSQAALEKELAQFQAEVKGRGTGLSWLLSIAGLCILMVAGLLWWRIGRTRNENAATSSKEGSGLC